MLGVSRTPAQRGDIGNHLRESRLARGYTSQAMARREIERLTGWRIAQSVYAEWESGRRVPEGENLDRLIAFYGPIPDGYGPAWSADAVANAIDRQTNAINRLSDLLERQFQERDAWEERVLVGMRLDRRYALDTQREVVRLAAAALGVAPNLPAQPTEGELDALERDPR